MTSTHRSSVSALLSALLSNATSTRIHCFWTTLANANVSNVVLQEIIKQNVIILILNKNNKMNLIHVISTFAVDEDKRKKLKRMGNYKKPKFWTEEKVYLQKSTKGWNCKRRQPSNIHSNALYWKGNRQSLN